MSDLRIRQLIESRLIAWAATQDPSLPVAVENVHFTPPTKGAYLRGFDLSAQTRGGFLQGGLTTFTGLYQITICAPKGEGSGPAGLIAAGLRALFPEFLVLQGAGFKVAVMTPFHVADGFADDTCWVVPTSFQYRCDVVT